MHKDSVTNLLTNLLTHEQRLAKYIIKNIYYLIFFSYTNDKKCNFSWFIK